MERRKNKTMNIKPTLSAVSEKPSCFAPSCSFSVPCLLFFFPFGSQVATRAKGKKYRTLHAPITPSVRAMFTVEPYRDRGDRAAFNTCPLKHVSSAIALERRWVRSQLRHQFVTNDIPAFFPWNAANGSAQC